MKTEKRIVYSSYWSKGNLRCMVHSERKAGDRCARFWFTGYNPFPCFYMMSTARCVTEWLTENGWKREIHNRISVTTDTIDQCTGEIVDHSVCVYNSVPVPVRLLTIDRSYQTLIKETECEEFTFEDILEDADEYYE